MDGNQDSKMRTGFQPHEVRDYEKRRYRHIDQRVIDRREKNILSRILSVIPGRSPLVLDMPCGYGRFSGMLRAGADPLVVSDLSYHMVHRARENAGPGPPATLGAVGDAAAGLPFARDVFGLVVSMRLFHHLRTPEKRAAVLKELSRVAKGPVILSYYRLNGLHRLQRRIRKSLRKKGARISMLPAVDFRREAGAAGLRINKSYSVLPGIHAQTIVYLEKERPQHAPGG